MIPKVIHYVCLGGGLKINKLDVEKCVGYAGDNMSRTFEIIKKSFLVL